jgi:hypothetical protein
MAFLFAVPNPHREERARLSRPCEKEGILE